VNENHKRFLSHLRDSTDGVFSVAKWLNRFGYEVVVKPTREAPRHEDWESYADGGDIYITQRIEVKRLGVNFTDNTWPFGDKFIVCAKHSFDRSVPRPFAYVITSSDQRYAAVVKSETSGQWKVDKRNDSRYEGVSQEFYFAPMDCVHFFRMEDECEPPGKAS